MRRCGTVRNAPNAGVSELLRSFAFRLYPKADANRQAYRLCAATMFLAALLALTGCASSNSGSGNNSGPQAVNPSNGSQQNATVGTVFPSPLVAVVTQGGAPVKGVSVTFTAPSSGSSGIFQNGKTTETDISDSNGLATSTKFTANSTAGAYSVTAAIPGVQATASFGLTNLPAPTTVINAQNGSGQSVLANTVFTNTLSAVVDQNGSPVSNATVTFTAPSSGPSGTFAGGALTDSEVTNSSGIATSKVFTANGVAGNYAVTASTSGATASAGFSLTNLYAVVATSGTPQSVAINQPFPNPLVATVQDGLGTPISGVNVTFTAPSGSGAGGTFTGNSATDVVPTGSNGQAASSTFTANSSTGTYQVVATVDNGFGPGQFNLSNTASSIASMVVPTAGTPQRQAAGSPFSPLTVTLLDANGNLVNGASVTFTVNSSSGAGGTFGSGTTETVHSDSNGHATVSDFTGNSTSGTYTITATSGTLTPGTFYLTNSNVGATITAYAFYLSGQSNSHPTAGTAINTYALAGGITVDELGNVTGGEEDYNDANGYTYSQVLVTAGTLSVNSTTGQGTLQLTTNNSNLGVSGTQTFGVQFVNTNHALIMQWDGSATSSGSIDVQTLTTPPSGGLAFVLAGVNSSVTPTAPIAFGGVMTSDGSSIFPTWSGTVDVNDNGSPTQPGQGTPISGVTLSSLDWFGRGQLTGINLGVPLNLTYYQVNAEALRVIEMDADLSLVGSAFGQGTNVNGASSASLGTSVFGVFGNRDWFDSNNFSDFGALGQFSTNPSAGTFSGIGDQKQLGTNFLIGVPIQGTYQIAGNGYGSLTITPGELGNNLSVLGLYLTDPSLNLNDPNNSSGGGGALLLDLDSALSGVAGFVIPQTDTSITHFTGSYAAGWQDLSNLHGGTAQEFDMLAQGSISALSSSQVNLNLTGLVSNPFDSLNTSATPSGAQFQGTPIVDPGSNTNGRYSMLGSSNPANLLGLYIPSTSSFQDFNVVVYQANGGQLFWFDVDNNALNSDSAFIGVLEQQGALNGIPAIRNSSGKWREPKTKAQMTRKIVQER